VIGTRKADENAIACDVWAGAAPFQAAAWRPLGPQARRLRCSLLT
jgi:hypothetical protein